MRLVKFESGVEVGYFCSLPSWPVLASEVASRRATWPSTTSSGRTSAVLEAAGLSVFVVWPLRNLTLIGCTV
jgi:hypothetical protein